MPYAQGYDTRKKEFIGYPLVSFQNEELKKNILHEAKVEVINLVKEKFYHDGSAIIDLRKERREAAKKYR